MINTLKTWQKKYLNNPGKYILYALGEILLIILGILIAININERQATKKDNSYRCQYLQELSFAFDKDIEDVEINLRALRKWNPQISSILNAINQKKLNDLDSLNIKVQALDDYVTFLQQSRSTIEELKYSNINPVTNRALKNQILVYQETKITYLLDQQRRLNMLNEKIHDYYLQIDVYDLNDMENDTYFINLIKRKHYHNDVMIDHYAGLLTELHEMKGSISEELGKKCEGQ
jgi:hypothetical protein